MNTQAIAILEARIEQLRNLNAASTNAIRDVDCSPEDVCVHAADITRREHKIVEVTACIELLRFAK